MDHAAAPELDAAVGPVVFVPGAAVLGPDGLGVVPGPAVREVLGRGALADGEGVQVLGGDFEAALHGVFDLDFVLLGGKGGG